MKHHPSAVAPFFFAALLIFGCYKPGVLSADNAPKGPPAAVKTSFGEVMSRLDPNGHLYAYLSTEQALARINESLEGLINMAKTGTEAGGGLINNPFVAPIIEGVLGVVEPAYRQSGISEISGVGMSSLAMEEDLWRSKMFVHHLPGKGTGLVWDAFGKQPHTMDVLSLAPDNTASLMHGDLDVKRVIDWVDTVFGEMLGGESVLADAPDEVKDILDSFGNEAGLLMTLDAENKMILPGFMFDRQDDVELDGIAFALLARVNDDTLMEMLGEALGGGFGPPPGTKVGGVTIHSIPLPIPLPFKLDLSPCYFQVGDYMVLASSESLAKRMAAAHGGKGRLTDSPKFKALAKGLNLKANGIYYADPQATEWGMQINELSMGKLEGALAKVYEIYEESLKEGIGMVSLFKVEEDGLLIEGNSTVNPYGGNIVHTIAGVGIAVASSLNDLQQSGLFEDLGGFGGPPGFGDDSDFDLPRVAPPEDEVDFEAEIKGFYEKYDIDDADKLTKEQLLEIAQGDDDRSNIPKEFMVFHIKGNEITSNLTFSSPEGENPWEMPEHHGTNKFVDGKYYLWDINVPEQQGGFDRVLIVIALSKNKTHFVFHEVVKSELRSLGIAKVTGKSQVEWTGSAVLEEPEQGSSIMTFKTTELCSDNKNTVSGMSYINGEPWYRREGTITKK